MKFSFPLVATNPTLSEKFERHFREVEHKRMVKSIIKQEVRAHLTEKMAPRLRALEGVWREAEDKFVAAWQAGDDDSMAHHQNEINRAEAEIDKITSQVGGE